MSPQAPRTAILTCMDARLDVAGFLDEWPNVAHVVRNAGGRASDDALRSLAASCAMGTKRVMIVHHTDCAMAKHTDEEIRELLPAGVETEVDFLTIEDPQQALAEDVQAVKGCDLLPAGTEVRAFVYDLDRQVSDEVETNS
ncbi:MAG: carbonic anhydrase [Solirubrobacterales bacterium]